MTLVVAQPTVIVAGAGIAGLVCARDLVREGCDVVLVEKTERVGGAILTVEEDGFLLEGGATTVQGLPVLREIAAEAGLGDDVLEAPSGLARWVYARGELRRAPVGPAAFLQSGLLSTRAKLGLLGEPWAGAGRADGDESVESFVRRRFGDEVHDYVVEPMVAGIFAGNTSRLSLASVFPVLARLETEYGSVLGGAVREGLARRGRGSAGILSFRGGLEALPRRLADALGTRLRTSSELAAIEVGGEGRLSVTLRGAGRAEEAIDADAVVLALPADVTTALLGCLLPQLGDALGQITAPSLAIANVALPRRDVAHPLDGFGFLVARGEGVRSLGCLWASSLFPGRAPDDMVSLSVFLGGANDSSAAHMDVDEIEDVVAADLRRTLDVRARPRILAIHRWEHAIPQYTVGHRARIEIARRAVAQIPGLFLAGSFLDGISVGACAARGRSVAREVARFVTADESIFDRGKATSEGLGR